MFTVGTNHINSKLFIFNLKQAIIKIQIVSEPEDALGAKSRPLKENIRD